MSLWGIVDLLMIAVGLSMDAFAVSVCKGLGVQKRPLRAGMIAGLYFGGFQALMPVLGYVCGSAVRRYIAMASRYVALIVLGLIGLNMIRESLKGKGGAEDGSLSVAAMVPAAVATSIDAFAVGVTLAALGADILFSALVIGAVTFLISFGGVCIGHCFGGRMEKRAGIFGGAILILIGLRIFVVG